MYRYRGIMLVLMVGSLMGCEKPDPEVVRQRMHLPEPGFVANLEQGGELF